MPRRQLVRRWEPRFGVSRQMLDVEVTYVAREKEDYLLQSTVELRDRLAHLQTLWKAADGVLEGAVAALPERDRLAVSCLVVRDLYLQLELHCTHLGKQTGVEPVGRQSPPATSASTSELTTIPFCEWLFEESDDDE
jgi:hypothetical protein